MCKTTTIHNAISYIESHLREPVTVGEIADAVGYSLFHFSRTFNRVVQHTPYDYLMRRRLSESARDLLTTDQQIIDIAYDYQFTNPETYTRAFRRMFGLTPSRARAQGHLPYRRYLPQITTAHLAHRTGKPIPQVTIAAFSPVRIVGLMTLTDGNNPEQFQELWKHLASRQADLEASRNVAFTLVQQPAPGEGQRVMTMIGFESTGPGAQWNLVETILPAATVARIPISRTPAELPIILDYVYHTWMPKARARPAATLEIIVHTPTLDGSLPGKPEAVLIPIFRPSQSSTGNRNS